MADEQHPPDLIGTTSTTVCRCGRWCDYVDFVSDYYVRPLAIIYVARVLVRCPRKRWWNRHTQEWIDARNMVHGENPFVSSRRVENAESDLEGVRARLAEAMEAIRRVRDAKARMDIRDPMHTAAELTAADNALFALLDAPIASPAQPAAVTPEEDMRGTCECGHDAVDHWPAEPTDGDVPGFLATCSKCLDIAMEASRAKRPIASHVNALFVRCRHEWAALDSPAAVDEGAHQ